MGISKKMYRRNPLENPSSGLYRGPPEHNNLDLFTII